MKKITLYCLVFLSFFSCKAQEKMTMKYIGHRYNGTMNKSFISDELLFLKSQDTFKINVRLPYDTIKHEIIDRGIFYSCHLKEDTIYTISLKKTCVANIPDVPNGYYKINTVQDKKDCSKFTEMKRDTKYEYLGNYGKYVDFGGVLYEIVGLTPNDGCFFQN